jgi:hypothetical protein
MDQLNHRNQEETLILIDNYFMPIFLIFKNKIMLISRVKEYQEICKVDLEGEMMYG